jgi:hypothetical protein
MTIRMIDDSIEFVTDNPAEAMQLRQLLREEKATENGTGIGTRTGAGAGKTPVSRKPRSRKLPTNIHPLIKALYDSPTGLTREGLAAALSVTPTTVPPLFRYAHKWAKQALPGQKFDVLVAKSKDNTGHNLWILTPLGKDLVEMVRAHAEVN